MREMSSADAGAPSEVQQSNKAADSSDSLNTHPSAVTWLAAVGWVPATLRSLRDPTLTECGEALTKPGFQSVEGLRHDTALLLDTEP